MSGGGSPDDGGRAVPYLCAFCGEEDLRPVEGGRWHCRACLRVFSVAFHGIEPASFSAPAHHDTAPAGTAPIDTTGRRP